MQSTRATHWAGVSALALLWFQPATRADALFTSYSSACNNGVGPVSGNSLVSTSLSPVCDASGTTVSASSFSGPLGMGGAVQATYRSPGTVLAFGQNTVSLETAFTLSGPAATTDVGLALDISSLLYMDPQTTASLQVAVTIGGFNRFGTVTESAAVFIGMTPFGMGGGSPYRIFVDPVNVAVGSPIPLVIQFTMTAQSNGHDRLVTLDAAHTLTFATTGPVFALPSGFGVQDLPELYLQNNGYVPPAAVPEPSTMGLLGAAGLLFVGLRRERR